MTDQLKTQNSKVTCLECQNEITIPESTRTGDVIECESCGIEYEVTEMDGPEAKLQIIEEEK